MALRKTCGLDAVSRIAPLGVLGAALLLAACGEDPVERAEPLPVRVATVGEASWERAQAYAGAIAPRVESAVAFRVPGRLVARRVEVGQRIAAGDVLGVLDPAPLELALRQSRSVVAALQAELAQAEDDVRRNAALAESRVVAPAQFDRLRTVRDTARFRLDEAQTRLEAARDDLGYASLRSPSAGVVSGVSAQAGQYLAPGEIAFRIAQIDLPEAEINVPENAVASLKAGMPASVELAANGALTLQGSVREIAPAADPVTRTFRVRISLPTHESVRIGMSVRVRLIAEASPATSLVSIPISALTSKGRAPAVWVVTSNERLELRPVAVEALDASSALVSSGLTAGERIVTAGVHRLDARQAIRIWDGRLP
jgi:multidrug efflux system membrane fusion protein